MKKLIFDPGGGLDELQIKVCSFSSPPFLFYPEKNKKSPNGLDVIRKCP